MKRWGVLVGTILALAAIVKFFFMKPSSSTYYAVKALSETEYKLLCAEATADTLRQIPWERCGPETFQPNGLLIERCPLVSERIGKCPAPDEGLKVKLEQQGDM
jgi:hypothetical protein